jgi:hypothetical protein
VGLRRWTLVYLVWGPGFHPQHRKSRNKNSEQALLFLLCHLAYEQPSSTRCWAFTRVVATETRVLFSHGTAQIQPSGSPFENTQLNGTLNLTQPGALMEEILTEKSRWVERVTHFKKLLCSWHCAHDSPWGRILMLYFLSYLKVQTLRLFLLFAEERKTRKGFCQHSHAHMCTQICTCFLGYVSGSSQVQTSFFYLLHI